MVVFVIVAVVVIVLLVSKKAAPATHGSHGAPPQLSEHPWHGRVTQLQATNPAFAALLRSPGVQQARRNCTAMFKKADYPHCGIMHILNLLKQEENILATAIIDAADRAGIAGVTYEEVVLGVRERNLSDFNAMKHIGQSWDLLYVQYSIFVATHPAVRSTT